MREKKNYFIYLAILVTCFITIKTIDPLTRKQKLKPNLQATTINFNSNFINITAVGQHRLISSFFWLTTLLQSDLEHYDNNDLNSWMYLRFKTITTLSPFFYNAYYLGSIYLSIVKDDELGAAELYDSGIDKYPNDYPLLYNAGFHYYSEMENYEKAIKYFERALQISRKHTFLPTLLARLKAGQESIESAKKMLEHTLSLVPKDSIIANRINHSLYSINAEIDLKCLNQKRLKGCNYYDFEGNPYLFIDGKYKSAKKWIPFRIRKRSAINAP